jgi:hypothetical protein
MSGYSDKLGDTINIKGEDHLIIKTGIGFPDYPDAIKNAKQDTLEYLYKHSSGQMKEAVGAEILRRHIMARCNERIAYDMHLLAFERYNEHIRQNIGGHQWVTYEKYAEKEDIGIVIKTRRVAFPYCSACNIVPRYDGTASLCIKA